MIIKPIPTLEDTKRFAETFAHHLTPGICVALDGDLGAGKTTFVKYCAHALGIQDALDSPTFTILKTYGPPRLHHMDAYRLDGDADDLEDALFDEDAYIFVEWASNITNRLPKRTLFLTFSQNSQERVVKINGNGVLNEDLFND